MRLTRSRPAIAALALGVLITLLPTARSVAHPVTGAIFPMGWQERTQTFYFSGPYWSTIPDIAARMRSAAARWTDLAADFTWVDGGDVGTFSTSPCTNPYVSTALFWDELDGPSSLPGSQGDWYGANYNCPYPGQPGRIYSAVIIMDGQESNWYTGNSTTVPAGHSDLYGVAAHEFGHAAGFDHWDPVDSSLCDQADPNHHTMCQSGVRGKNWDRTPAAHDAHTFNARYP